MSQSHTEPPLLILVADDNRDIAESFAELLDAVGHQTRVAYDGQAAVDLAAREAPDVALLDIGMPRLDGYQVAERIRATCPNTLLIAVSGWGSVSDKRKAAAAGFHHHFVKPADFASIMEVLCSCQSTCAARRPQHERRTGICLGFCLGDLHLGTRDKGVQDGVTIAW